MPMQGVRYQKVLDRMIAIILEAEIQENIPRGLSFHLSPDGCKIVQEGVLENGKWTRDNLERIQYDDSTGRYFDGVL